MFDHESAVVDAGGKMEPISKPSSIPLRRTTQVAVFAAFLLMIGTGSAQVTWLTLPAAFRAATNDVSVINYKPLPEWARKVIDEDNAGLLKESLRAVSDATNAAALNQRVFYYVVSTNALKVTEWCLVNGASVGTMDVSGSWKSTWVQPLVIAIRSTNAPMVRLLICRSKPSADSPNRKRDQQAQPLSSERSGSGIGLPACDFRTLLTML